MAHSSMMSGTATELKQVRPVDPDSVVVPLRLAKRLPYRPSILAAKLRRIVAEVVKERIAREREAASNPKSQ